MNSKNLFPIIVPSSYVSGTWNLPHHKFPLAEFILTWVEFETSSAMTYLTEARYKELNNSFENWQRQAFENLRKEGDYFYTHVKYRDSKKEVIFISFINDDGIGSSRILLNIELSNAFPNGYFIAFPDRSCGLVISKDVTETEQKEMQLQVRKMYNTAITAMSPEVHDPKQFTLPDDWTAPIDLEFSRQIIDAIPK